MSIRVSREIRVIIDRTSPHTTMLLHRDHPFKTLAFLGGWEKVKILPNLPNLPNFLTNSSKKLPTVEGVGVKNREKFADVLNGWSHTTIFALFWVKAKKSRREKEKKKES